MFPLKMLSPRASSVQCSQFLKWLSCVIGRLIAPSFNCFANIQNLGPASMLTSFWPVTTVDTWNHANDSVCQVDEFKDSVVSQLLPEVSGSSRCPIWFSPAHNGGPRSGLPVNVHRAPAAKQHGWLTGHGSMLCTCWVAWITTWERIV